MRPSIHGLYAARQLLTRRTLQRMPMSTEVKAAPRKMEGPGDDPRPPWVYVGSRLISFLIIPTVAFYAVFFYDFGDHEHVFQAPRRWAARSINSFLTLSEEEEKLVQQEHQKSSAESE